MSGRMTSSALPPPSAPSPAAFCGSDEDKARLRVIEKLKARGYPFPPPGRDEILALYETGNWPPVGACQLPACRA